MAKIKTRAEARLRRHRRVRKKISGTPEKPRLNVYRSLTGIYAQVIDDESGRTLASASTIDGELRKKMKGLSKTEQAALVGKAIAERALAVGIKQVVFDRGGIAISGACAPWPMALAKAACSSRNTRGAVMTNYQAEQEFDERVIEIRRVATVVKGGRRFSFRVTVVVGDNAGSVGVGTGKAGAVPDAIRKATKQARQNMRRITIYDTTIPYEVVGKVGGARVLLKPASRGTGVIAAGGVRAVLEAAGISDILTKSLGSNNDLNVVYATMAALEQLRSPQQVADERGIPLERVLPYWSRG